jgi:hypothetical protein
MATTSSGLPAGAQFTVTIIASTTIGTIFLRLDPNIDLLSFRTDHTSPFAPCMDEGC